MIEPIFNEVSQTLSKALNGKIDIIERRHDPANDLEYIDDDDDDDGVDDEDDDYDDVKYYPTLPPIYPSMKTKPESRSLKSNRLDNED